MTDQTTPACVSRRTVLFAAAGAAPLLALGATGANAAKLAQSAVKYQASPKDGKRATVANSSSLPTHASLSRARSLRTRVVRALGQEGRDDDPTSKSGVRSDDGVDRTNDWVSRPRRP